MSTLRVKDYVDISFRPADQDASTWVVRSYGSKIAITVQHPDSGRGWLGDAKLLLNVCTRADLEEIARRGCGGESGTQRVTLTCPEDLFLPLTDGASVQLAVPVHECEKGMIGQMAPPWASEIVASQSLDNERWGEPMEIIQRLSETAGGQAALWLFAKHPDILVRRRVAACTRHPELIQWFLARELARVGTPKEDVEMRYVLADNPAATLGQLETLSKDDRPRVARKAKFWLDDRLASIPGLVSLAPPSQGAGLSG